MLLVLMGSVVMHSCQPLLGVNLSPEFVNLYFPHAGQGLLLFQSNRHVLVVQNTHAQLKILFVMRFLSLLH